MVPKDSQFCLKAIDLAIAEVCLIIQKIYPVLFLYSLDHKNIFSTFFVFIIITTISNPQKCALKKSQHNVQNDGGGVWAKAFCIHEKNE